MGGRGRHRKQDQRKGSCITDCGGRVDVGVELRARQVMRIPMVAVQHVHRGGIAADKQHGFQLRRE